MMTFRWYALVYYYNIAKRKMMFWDCKVLQCHTNFLKTMKVRTFSVIQSGFSNIQCSLIFNWMSIFQYKCSLWDDFRISNVVV